MNMTGSSAGEAGHGPSHSIFTTLCCVTALVFVFCISAQAGTRVVKGVVRDQTGATVSGAEVSIHAGKYASVQRTGESGSFSFELSSDFPSGEPAVLTVHAPGFASQERHL